MHSLLRQAGLLAGITALVFFGFGLVRLLAGDPDLEALLAAFGPGARSLALAVLALDALAGAALLAGCLLTFFTARHKAGLMIAALGCLPPAATLLWASRDLFRSGGPSAAAPAALAALACLGLCAGCLAALATSRRRR